MHLLISAADETADLSTWLGREGKLRGHVHSRPAPTAAETMGAEIVIAAAVMGVSALAQSICGYLAVRQRNRGTDLDLMVSDESGKTWHVVANRSTDPAQLAGLILGADRENQPALEASDAPAGR